MGSPNDGHRCQDQSPFWKRYWRRVGGEGSARSPPTPFVNEVSHLGKWQSLSHHRFRRSLNWVAPPPNWSTKLSYNISIVIQIGPATATGLLSLIHSCPCCILPVPDGFLLTSYGNQPISPPIRYNTGPRLPPLLNSPRPLESSVHPMWASNQKFLPGSRDTLMCSVSRASTVRLLRRRNALRRMFHRGGISLSSTVVWHIDSKE